LNFIDEFRCYEQKCEAVLLILSLLVCMLLFRHMQMFHVTEVQCNCSYTITEKSSVQLLKLSSTMTMRHRTTALIEGSSITW